MFAAYCGFLRVGFLHTHPILVMFLRLLLVDPRARKIENSDLKNVTIDINRDNSKGEVSLETLLG